MVPNDANDVSSEATESAETALEPNPVVATASAPKEVSENVTDTGPTSNTNDKGILVLENVLLKPAISRPKKTLEPTFGFGKWLD